VEERRFIAALAQKLGRALALRRNQNCRGETD